MLAKVKKNSFHVKCEIYPLRLFCFFGSREDLFKELERFVIKKDLDEMKGFTYGAGKVIQYNNLDMILWMPIIPKDYSHYGTLAHEIFHTVEYLFEIIGIEHHPKTSEAWTYMVQFVTTEIYKGLDKLKE